MPITYIQYNPETGSAHAGDVSRFDAETADSKLDEITKSLGEATVGDYLDMIEPAVRQQNGHRYEDDYYVKYRTHDSRSTKERR